MRLASISVHATILSCIFVGVIAANSAIGQQNTPARGAKLDDDPRPTQQLFFRKLLQRYNIIAPIEENHYKTEHADPLRRRLAQFIDNESPPEGEPPTPTAFDDYIDYAGAPGPAPGPQAETTPAPGPYNPFVPPNDSNLACCCRTAATYYEEPYQEPTPPYCCCGSRSSCCPQGSLISAVCGGGQVCGILMLLSALIAVVVLSICMTGTFYARRRRRQLLAMHGATGGLPNGAIGGVGRRPIEQITMNEADIPGLRVKYGVENTVPIEGEAGEEADGIPTTTVGTMPEAETKECPICLDTVSLHGDTWAVFPCTHGCCRPCFSDLLRHSSRRVNNSAVWAVMCPLCRKIAVAPEGEIPASPTGAAIPVADATVLIETTTATSSEEQEQEQPPQAVPPPPPRPQ